MMHKKVNVLVRKSNFIVVLLLFGFCGYGQTVVDATIFKDGIASPNSTINYSANTPITGVLSFNKSEDRWVDLNAVQDDLDGASRSIFMWVKSEANVSSEVQMLFAINRADRGNAICNFFIDDYYDNLEIYDGNNSRNATFDMRGEEGEVWNYVGYTYNNTSNETVIYVNGIENLRYTNDQATTATSRFSLGQEFDNVTQESNHFNGDMAEISIWNDVLTGQDIRNSMSTKITNTHAKYTNLIAYYSVFGTATDDTTILKDHSNNNNNGIIKSNASWGVDFTNVQTIAGFNAVDWYDTFSWKKNGVEVGSDKEFTTNAAIGNFEFTATKNILQSTNTWAVTESNTATVLDNLMDTTLCIDEAAAYSVTNNQVNYLDFEKDNQDYVNVSSITSSLIDTDRSIFMWLKKESNVSRGTSYHLLTIHDASGETAVSRFYIDSSEELGIHTNGTNYSGNTSISSDVWTHVGYTYDATNETTVMYINGNAIRAITGIAMPIASGAIATLGMRFEENGPSRFFDGKMTDITVWDKKLTEEEVAALKANAPTNNALNLVAKYGTLQNIADTRVFDATANNHTGYATASSMLVTTAEETIEDYSTSNNDTFSWTKQGVEITTTASASIAPNEGTEAYSVTYGTPFFQKIDHFSLSYTNLIPTQPAIKKAGVTGSASFVVDDVDGADYQWFQKALSGSTVNNADFSFQEGINDVLIVDETLYAATNSGLAYSNDKGSTWTAVLAGVNGFPDTPLVFSLAYANDKIYACTSEGLAVSEDNRQNWTVIATKDGGELSSLYPEFISIEGNTICVAGSSTIAGSGIVGGISISKDGGQTWTNTQMGGDSGLFSGTDLRDVAASGDTIFIAGGGIDGDLAISRDGGQTWNTTEGGNGFSGIIRTIAIDGQNVFLATSVGLSISNDLGVTWKPTVTNSQSNFHATNNLSDVFVENSKIYVTAFVSSGVAISEDGGNTWNKLVFRDYGISSINCTTIYVKDGNMLFGSQNHTPNAIGLLLNTSSLSDNSDNAASNQIQGATSHQLTINNLSLEASGAEYFVEVSKNGCTPTSDVVALTVVEESFVNWTGVTSTDWATITNWATNAVPTAIDNVVIPDVTRQPIIATNTTAISKDLTLETGASLTLATDAALTIDGNFSSADANALVANSGSSIMVTGTATSDVLYKRDLQNPNWYLISSPVNGESVKDFLTSHTFLAGQGDTPNKNVSFANYKNDGSVWNYSVDGDFDGLNADDTTDLMAQGEGYSIKIATPGDVSFSGTMNTSTINTRIITKGINKFNLVGNPFMAYLKLGDFFATNAAESVLSESTTWFWNGSTYETKPALVDGDFKIAPAQAFFVSAGVASVNTTFDISNVTHEGTDTFLKNSDIRPQIKLFMTDGANSRATRLFYIEGTTTGFDNGYDGTLFGGVTQSFALYTHLVSDSVGQKLGVQVLPPSNYENMMVPIGVNASKGTKITFTIESLNLPKGIAVFIEDKQSKTFTRVDEANSSYAVTLAENVNDIGRFFLYTTTSVLSASNINLENVSMYKSDRETLRIVGLSAEKAHLKMYNVLGKQLLSTTFQASGVKDIAVSNLAAGIYIVELETEKGSLNKKIILE